MTKALMTAAQIRAAGYLVEAYVPIASNRETRQHPWIVRRLGGLPVCSRYRTRREAIAVLHEELTSPDGVLNPTQPEAA